MESELKIWLNYSPKGGEPEPTNEDLDDLFLALRQVIPGERLHLSQYRYIGIMNCSPAELASAQTAAADLRIQIVHTLEERLSRAELRQVRFARLTVEGDHVDKDTDANPLNRFPCLLCPACHMPDECRLPDPYYVSARQLRRRGQDGVPGLRLQHNREVFGSSCGVFVASDRLKRILQVLEQPLTCAVVAAVPANEIAPGLWVLRPAQAWGRRQNCISAAPCPQCGQPRKCHLDPDAGPEAFYANRLVMEEAPMPQLDLMCSETWFGDRTRRPSESADFLRDVLVSGRLYEVLLRAKVRGLMCPEEVVAFHDRIPMDEPQAAQTWMNAKLDLLRREALL